MHQDMLGADRLGSASYRELRTAELTLQKELHLLSLYKGFNETNTTGKKEKYLELSKCRANALDIF